MKAFQPTLWSKCDPQEAAAVMEFRFIQNTRIVFFLTALDSHSSYKCWLLQVSKCKPLRDRQTIYVLYKLYLLQWHSFQAHSIPLVLARTFFFSSVRLLLCALTYAPLLV